MKTIYNVKINELEKYPDLSIEINNLVQYLNPVNVYGMKDIDTFQWGLIKKTQYSMSRNNLNENQVIELFKTFTGIKKIEELKAVEFYTQVKFIANELLKLAEKEFEFLSNELTGEELEAGFEDLSKFGYMATMDSLANGDVLKYKEIEEQPYNVIFSKLLLQKTKADIEKKYMEIKMRK